MHLSQYLCPHFVTRHSIPKVPSVIIVSIHIEHCSVSPSAIDSFISEFGNVIPKGKRMYLY